MAAEVKEVFEGKWKLYKNVNYDKYLDNCGLAPLERKIAEGLKPTFKFSVDGDIITTKVRSGPIKNKIKFRLGEEYEDKYMGRAFKGVTTWSDGKLRAHVIPEDKSIPEQFFDRQVCDGELVNTMSTGGVEAKQYFKRVP